MAAVKAGISSLGVIPAKAGVQFFILRCARWTPAFAGVTGLLVRPEQIHKRHSGERRTPARAGTREKKLDLRHSPG
jgi:hypothetical protein